MTASELRELFAAPPASYRPMPFWWWVGEPLDRARLAWQLDQLLAQGVGGVIVGYNHFPDGRNDPGDPPVFSEAWWELFNWVAAECERRGLILGFQDYTLVNPTLAEIGRATPGMAAGELVEAHVPVAFGETAELAPAAGSRPVMAMSYRISESGAVQPGSATPVTLGQDGNVRWTPPSAGGWLLSLVSVRPTPFDPMHPEAGAKAIDRLYAPFQRRCPDHFGKTLKIFFQDELDFGMRMPMWSDRLPAAFAKAKGYDLLPQLPALWHDVGPATAKLRVDFADVVTTLLEQAYFIPIYHWHEKRGTLLGNDNAGRGAIGTGRRYYGDYFRTMRWYGAPGTDDPKLSHPRAFAGLKVNSSIAQLYRRSRVWVEGFHSSGWGATPAAILAGINEDFVLGANFINLHGLYYTTYGSWWEWAAPDFHFRQPYWTAAGAMNDYLARHAALLSQGAHRCDTAILYPITAIEGGLTADVRAGDEGPGSLSEQQRGESEPPTDPAEVLAFQLGRGLLAAGENFDFLDFESAEWALIEEGRLVIAGGAYRALVLPMMSTIRWRTLVRALEFFRQGGWVVAIGCLPRATERHGTSDPDLAAALAELFGARAAAQVAAPEPQSRASAGLGRGGADSRVEIHDPARHGWQRNAQGGAGLLVATADEALHALRSRGDPDFAAEGAALEALHRRIGELDLYWVRNPKPAAVSATVRFRQKAQACLWDAWTGEARGLAQRTEQGVTALRLEFAPGELQLIVFGGGGGDEGKSPRAPDRLKTWRTLPAEGWDFELEPTLDNRYGDFRRPPSPALLGADVRRFKYREEQAGEAPPIEADTDESGWRSVAAGVGQHLWKLGPLTAKAAEKLEPKLKRQAAIDDARWQPVEFSRTTGIERDPWMLDWRSGPHGLKKTVPDEFLDLTTERPGAVWFVWSTLEVEKAGTFPLVAGSRAAFTVWVNGEEVLSRREALPPGVFPAWNLPYYESEPVRAEVALQAGANPVLMRLVQPPTPGQRLRAYVAVDAPPVTDRPALRWFAGKPAWTFNPMPRRVAVEAEPGPRASPGLGGGHGSDRIGRGDLVGSEKSGEAAAFTGRAVWYRFKAPPGLASFELAVRGTLEAWVGGHAADVAKLKGGRYRVTVPAPEAGTTVAALRVQPAADSFGGDAIPEPIKLLTDGGKIALGDWSQQGLATYSGAAWYRRVVDLGTRDLAQPLTLDLGDVRATATVWWNDQLIGTRVCPPWTFAIGVLARPGANTLAIRVANTLANHYSEGIPTPYFYPEQTVSGLLGPVRLLR